MHILVVNDDGPPSQKSSPYVHSFIKTLQDCGHVVSVVFPHTQRSWIGKAHFVSQNIQPTYFRPGTLHVDDGTTHASPLALDHEGEEWVLIDGTPASCVQMGLFHFYQDRGPVDLVVSGPNYGRNSSTLFMLSSGTLGGAFEGACFGKKSIALSYAFTSRDHDPVAIAATSHHAVKVIEYLYDKWGSDVEVYSINVPLHKDVAQHKTLFTHALQNYWKSGSSFRAMTPGEEAQEQRPDEKEHTIRQQEGATERAGRASTQATPGIHARHQHRTFKFAPNFADVHASVDASGPGNDGWEIKQNNTSITPLRAAFAEATAHHFGEVKLPVMHLAKRSTTDTARIQILVAYEDPYVQPLILAALHHQSFSNHVAVLDRPLTASDLDLNANAVLLHVAPYENIIHETLLHQNTAYFANAYIIRKALIRKHFLADTLAHYRAKNPQSSLKGHVPLTLAFELDYAEFLDDALLEAYELHESWARNEGKEIPDREWWILKPSMSDRAQGIRLFSTATELQAIFDDWEDAQDDKENDDADALSQSAAEEKLASSQSAEPTMTSQLRHFVVQPYIAPLLLPEHENRKFHIRTYVLALGALQVYVYRDMLALFAEVPYRLPGVAEAGSSPKDAPAAFVAADTSDDPGIFDDLRPHLTNTCSQAQPSADAVCRFWDLVGTAQIVGKPNATNNDNVCAADDKTHNDEDSSNEATPQAASTSSWREDVFDQICAVTKELFTAAVAQPTTFQPLPNAFEIFGIDWLVDDHGTVWLLEVNAFPDFAQSGPRLQDLISGLWASSLRLVLQNLMGLHRERNDKDGASMDGDRADRLMHGDRMVKVLDIDLQRR